MNRHSDGSTLMPYFSKLSSAFSIFSEIDDCLTFLSDSMADSIAGSITLRYSLDVNLAAV